MKDSMALVGILVEQILDGMKATRDPYDAGALLAVVLANVAGNIPDGAWADLAEHATQPCGNEGCDCEVRRTALVAALTMLREDHKAKNAEHGTPWLKQRLPKNPSQN